MENTDFKGFLDKNDLKIAKLPQPIQDKIKYFKELGDLIQVVEDDYVAIIADELEQLDYEILMDIKLEYQDRLENNERLEKLAKSPTLKKALKKKAATRLKTDESILEELVKMGRTKNLDRPELVAMGIKTKIGRDVVIGNYVLKRVSLFYHRYDLIALKK